jgi:hypothetical protein
MLWFQLPEKSIKAIARSWREDLTAVQRQVDATPEEIERVARRAERWEKRVERAAFLRDIRLACRHL